MSEPPLPIAEIIAARRRAQPPRAKIYLRLLWALPGAVMLALGVYRFINVEDNGPITSIKLTTKPGLVGQASEAIRLVEPGNPDLYLKLTIVGQAEPLRTATRTDTPVGNGLVWDLAPPVLMRDIRQVDVWDEDIVRDNHKDHLTMGVWRADGQTYSIELLGTRYAPPGWALPVAIAGGVIVLLVFLRFVWDQVI